jgi:hypothetical protein
MPVLCDTIEQWALCGAIYYGWSTKLAVSYVNLKKILTLFVTIRSNDFRHVRQSKINKNTTLCSYAKTHNLIASFY